MPTNLNLFQRVGDFWDKREEYRQQALASLRRRESLPTPERLLGTFYQREDGAFYPEPPGRATSLDTTFYPNGNGGYSQWAKGSRKGTPREEADRNWGRSSEFEILEVADDGRLLADELRDLNRDAAGMAQAERVSHGQAGEQAPGLVVEDPADDEGLDRVLQEFLRKGKP